ncbi:site-specific DNA-methyltransferase [candidate division KSB1 bacterium]|nr:site-specific DNA-methyltransferase [candidate division KSB1 bacterium]MBL7094585.1 site-specific DNA-methyltransferase [candidate division KSB1 bacterium]
MKNKGFTIIRLNGDSLKKDIVESAVETIKDTNHPAVYPLNVIKEFTKLLTSENDIVLDPFNGSGTTCVAAKKLRRRYIGIDINQEYCNIAKKRLGELYVY